jgi:cell division septation protein DedD
VNINYKQPQFELFPGNSSNDNDPARPKYLLANLTLSIENLVVLSILGIMVAVFAYSLGVERGKHVMAMEFKSTALAASTAAIPVVAGHPSATTPVAATAVRQTVPATAGQAVTTVAPAANKPAVTVAVPAVVAQKPAQAATPAFKYTIQVASYAGEKVAQRAASDLNKNGFETFVMQKGKYVILCVGKFNQKNEAMSVISKLKSKYKDALVRSM